MAVLELSITPHAWCSVVVSKVKDEPATSAFKRTQEGLKVLRKHGNLNELLVRISKSQTDLTKIHKMTTTC